MHWQSWNSMPHLWPQEDCSKSTPATQSLCPSISRKAPILSKEQDICLPSCPPVSIPLRNIICTLLPRWDVLCPSFHICHRSSRASRIKLRFQAAFRWLPQCWLGSAGSQPGFHCHLLSSIATETWQIFLNKRWDFGFLYSTSAFEKNSIAYIKYTKWLHHDLFTPYHGF